MLIDLKRPKPKNEKKGGNKTMDATVGPSYEERPYCLRFTLESPELEALGITPHAFKDMEPITATILVDPISIRDIESKSEDQCQWDKNRNQSVEFQIMKIDLGTMTPKKEKDQKFAGFNSQQKKGPGE